jgi:hypothetical protein
MERLPRARGPQVHGQPHRLTEIEQAAALLARQRIERRRADGADEDGIAGEAQIDRGRRQRVAEALVGAAADGGLAEDERQSRPLAEGRERAHGLRRHFLADAVAGQDRDAVRARHAAQSTRGSRDRSMVRSASLEVRP